MSNRHTAAATTLSWIPSDAIEDAPLLKAPFSMRVLHYDNPPPESRFPRHWIYGPDGELTSKSAVTAFNEWYRRAHGEHTPWGDEDSPALVVDVETEVERSLSTAIMRSGARPAVRSIEAGTLLVEQGGAAGPLFVILDGVLSVDVDGAEVGELGPGAVVGERAHLEDTARTATLRARTKVRIAEAAVEDVDTVMLQRLSLDHHREDA